MEEINQLQAKIRAQIGELPGGHTAVALKMGKNPQSVWRSLNPRYTKSPRIETLRAIKKALKECQREQDAVLAELSA